MNEQIINPSDEQVTEETAKVAYEAPEVADMGKVEELTALGTGVHDDLIVLGGHH